MRQLAIILWFISSVSFAAVHVCTDADGRKLFTDGDCPSGTLLKQRMDAVVTPTPAPVPVPYLPPAQSSSSFKGLKWVGRPLDVDQPKSAFQSSEKHANFASIWASKLQLGFLPLFFMFVVAASGLFLLAYLFLMVTSRLSHKRQREAGQNIQPHKQEY